MYLMVWSVYSLAGLLALLAMWYLLAGFTRRALLRGLIIVLAVLLWLPVGVNGESSWLAPVLAALATELLAGNHEAALALLPRLLAGLLAGVLLTGLLAVPAWRKRRLNRR